MVIFFWVGGGVGVVGRKGKFSGGKWKSITFRTPGKALFKMSLSLPHYNTGKLNYIVKIELLKFFTAAPTGH